MADKRIFGELLVFFRGLFLIFLLVFKRIDEDRGSTAINLGYVHLFLKD